MTHKAIAKKLSTARWLMYSSMLLLVLFQAYWLRNVYEDTFRAMRRELSVLFRETAFKRQMQLMESDTATFTLIRDTSSAVNRVGIRIQSSDSAAGLLPHGASGENRMISIRANGALTDTANRVKVARRFMEFEGHRQDTLPLTMRFRMPVLESLGKDDTLLLLYKQALEKAGLPTTFAISQHPFTQAYFAPSSEGRGRNAGVPVIGFPLMRNLQPILIEVDFGPAPKYLLPKMAGQFLFALAMLGITAIAFVFLYRNLRAQHRLALLKNDFISNMTHELKTPLATVGVALEAIRNFGADPDRTREYLEISSAELNRLNMLIDKVLRITLFEQDKMEMQFSPVDLVGLTHQVMSTLKLQAEKQQAHMHFESTQDGILVQGDSLHLMSVLYNLLDNALKYSGKEARIRVELEQQGGRVRWSVSDNGPGIAHEYQSRIFEKFFRVPHGDVHNVKGYGLGLSYVASVVQQHHGQIALHSEPGKGCTFVVELPAMEA